jgi:cytochrome c553
MRRQLSKGWRRVLAYGLGFAIAGLGLVVLIAWSGVYSVAASRGHWPMVEWLLQFGMENSVETHAPDIAAPRLDDPDLVRLGAAHYLAGCAECHGAPGGQIGRIAQGMLPPPPDLRHRSDAWTVQELFWIVKHGIKYTGMPAWPTQDRDDEVWAVIAFLRELPALDAASYRALAYGGLPDEPQDGEDVALIGGGPRAVGACARCHGAGDRPPASGLVPRLHGQPAEMLLQALHAFASGERPSGIMQPVAAALSPRVMRDVADYYAGLHALPARTAAPVAQIEAGRRLAADGDPTAEIPSCLACHDRQALPIYPRLAAQNAPYLANRLRAMQRSPRERTATQAIMTPIARRLTEQQIVDLSAYFASLPPGPRARGTAVP